jgi:hypothetical protein
MNAIILMIVLLLGTGVGSVQAGPPPGAAPGRPPLPPEGIRVITPDPSLQADIRAFSGSWYGLWIDPSHPDRGIREILVVEEVVSKDEIKVILSWGDCPVCQSKADWRRFTGKLASLCIDWNKLPKPFYHLNTDALGQKKVLSFGYPEGRTFIFVLDNDNELIGTDGAGIVVMSRLK